MTPDHAHRLIRLRQRASPRMLKLFDKIKSGEITNYHQITDRWDKDSFDGLMRRLLIVWSDDNDAVRVSHITDEQLKRYRDCPE